MKMQKFLNDIQYKLLNRADIQFNTVKEFIELLSKNMSRKEKEKHYTQISMILAISTRQLRIDDMAKIIKIEQYEKEFDQIKKNLK